ncbi:MAG: restriction endonuclease [candidate division WOR-3 bacterium]
MLSDPKVIRLFELLERNRTGLEPVFAPRRDSWVSYPLIERELGADPDYSVQLLDDLTRLGYLSRQFWDKVFFCPACNSQDLKLTTICPKCQSAHIARQRVLEHRNCGYVGGEEDFLKNGVRVCPKCRVELVLIGNDYSSPGLRYHCLECDTVVEQPEERWTCRACQRNYAKGDVRELLLYAYAPNHAQLARLRVERIPKARVQEFLAREGYEVRDSVQTVGRSGAEHKIDLIATKRNGPLEHRIVVGFASAEEAVDSEEVIKLYAKAYDVNAQDIILVASPKLSEDAQQFASHYHIKVFNADELDRMSTQLAV